MIIYVLLVTIPCLASASTVPEHFSHVPMHEIVGAVGRHCIKKTGATQDELQLFHDYKKLSTRRQSKCMVACVLEKYGTIDPDNGSIMYDALNLYFFAAFKPELHDTVMKTVIDCDKKAKPDPDHCERIFNVTQCYYDALDKINVKPIPFWSVKET